jgi:hypothetical protein
MADWAIEPLADHHDRARFVCGKPPLDDWIRRDFEPFQDDPSRLFLMIRDLRQAGLKPLAE